MDVVQFSSSPKGHRGQRGFTLIEIMVVVVILGILAAMVVPKVLDCPDQARATAARQDISGLMQALKLYRLDQGRYPEPGAGLEGARGAPCRCLGEQLALVPGAPAQRSPGQALPVPESRRERRDRRVLLGADGQPGGEGINADIGSWQL